MSSQDEAFLRAYQQKVEQKLRENEIAVIDHWRERLDRLIVLKPDGIASLQLEMKKLSDMMKNRVSALKRSSDG